MTAKNAKREGSSSMAFSRESAGKNHNPVSEEPPSELRAELAKTRHELADMVASLASMNTLLQQMAAIQEDIAGQLKRVQAGLDEVAVLAPLVQQHEIDVRRHEFDIRERLADRTAERSDLESERYREQQDVWKRFDMMISRRVEHVVNDILRHDDRLNDTVAKAERVSQVVRLLFPGNPDSDPGAIDTGDLRQVVGQQRLDDLRREAAEIGQDATKFGMVAFWGPVNEQPDWFEDWRSSHPVGPAFVVVPAWGAGDRLVGPGKVFRA